MAEAEATVCALATGNMFQANGQHHTHVAERENKIADLHRSHEPAVGAAAGSGVLASNQAHPGAGAGVAPGAGVAGEPGYGAAGVPGTGMHQGGVPATGEGYGQAQTVYGAVPATEGQHVADATRRM